LSVGLRRYLMRGSVPLGVAIAGVVAAGRYRRAMVAAYARVARSGDVVATECGPIQYAEVGSGPAVLIVHGAGGGCDQGVYFARAIGGSFRWLAPSRFGFLGTPAPDGADSALQAEAYACLLDTLEIDRVAVVGVSMGGTSALEFALRHPHRTPSLALISAASRAIPPRPAVLAAMFELFLHDVVFWAIVQLVPRALLVALGANPRIRHGPPAGRRWNARVRADQTHAARLRDGAGITGRVTSAIRASGSGLGPACSRVAILRTRLCGCPPDSGLARRRLSPAMGLMAFRL
jgi:pimeloyl-ACP methyl ester carboxylesterase